MKKTLAKKAGLKKIIGWIVFIAVIILFVLFIKNGMNFQATVQQILGFFG